MAPTGSGDCPVNMRPAILLVLQDIDELRLCSSRTGEIYKYISTPSGVKRFLRGGSEFTLQKMDLEL